MPRMPSTRRPTPAIVASTVRRPCSRGCRGGWRLPGDGGRRGHRRWRRGHGSRHRGRRRHRRRCRGGHLRGRRRGGCHLHGRWVRARHVRARHVRAWRARSLGRWLIGHSVLLPRCVSGLARPGSEDALQLVRRRLLELIVPAVGRLLVGAPALERRPVSEPISLQVIVRDLRNAFQPKWLPGQVLTPIPARRRARQPLPGRLGGGLPRRPFGPRVTFERVLPERLELRDELGAARPT